MRGWFSRALVAAAGVAVILTVALPSMAAAPNGLSAPAPRLAGVNALVIPVVVYESGSGPEDMLRNPLDEISGTLDLGNGFALESGLNADIGRVLERYAPSVYAYDGLFYSSASLGSRYLTLASGGSWLGLRFIDSSGLNFSFGRATTSPGLNRYLLSPRSALTALTGTLPYDARLTDSVLAGMSWNFAKWAGVGFTASRTTERGGVLGLNNRNIAAARTSAMGVTAHVGLGGGWMTTATYSEGLTQLDLKPGAYVADSSMRTQSYGVAVAKRSVFSKNDALGVAFARPAQNLQPFTTDSSNDLQFYGRDKLFPGAAQETDFELGYKTEFFGDSIALQANASYQMNYGGQTGNNAVSLLSRAKIKF